MRLLICSIVATLVVAPAFAATPASPLDDPSLTGNSRYDRCLSQVKRNPSLAYSQAGAWEGTGGGAAATHCQALALVALHRYGEAATKLDSLGRSAQADAVMRATLLDQAGNAWLLAKSAGSAETSFSAALTLSPRDADILVDRARARALARNWIGANADLTAAIAIDPNSPELYVLRSSARHALGQKGQARADIDQALNMRPGYAEALVERGALKQEAGDGIGAKADWQQVVSSSPGSDAAVAARAYLQGTQAPAKPSIAH